MAKKSYIRIATMLIEVEVIEHKKSYGRDRCVIKPVSGEGQAVVSSEKVIIK